eukprot:TRINITY_DN108010_c0_g1_i1.p1 TRINITY_DN108010_c0_g1~~TRINITY_DN108010_c0_g1_i1.p1  ORF type:complete len:323 (+),score=34.43 TRINITY_DN108010_c0_g1_i1:66-1034(+)
MVSAECALRLNERLFDDDATKDVEIEVSDGVLKAHSVILIAASDAFRGMLSNGVAATANPKRLSWKEQSKVAGQFFLRLLYTGTVEESEWGGDTCVDVPDIIKIVWQQDEGTPDVGRNAGVYQIVPDIKWCGMPVWKCDSTDNYLHFTKNRLWVVAPFHQSPVRGAMSPAVEDGSGANLATFEQDEEGKMPHQISAWNHVRNGTWNKVTCPTFKVSVQQRSIPIQLLLESLQLAKMYEVRSLVDPLLSTVQKRLLKITFNTISQNAIKADIQLLRMRCLKFAEDDGNGVRELFESHKLSPEVEAELAGMWPIRTPEKRRRML